MPVSLRVENVSYAFGSVTLFEAASFQLTPGWCGLIGPNGSGKSTLLELLASLRVPTSGVISLRPREARVALCEQRVDVPPRLPDVDDPVTANLARWVAWLELGACPLEQWERLSHGQHKRWQLAVALAHEPDVLLLDEPTNHLDSQARSLIERALRRYQGIGVLVSHDRALLDALTANTLRLHAERCRLWPGSYAKAKVDWEREQHAARVERETAVAELARLRRSLSNARRVQNASTASRNTGARMKSKYDSDARTLSAASKAESAQRAHAASLRRLAEQVERQADALPDVEAVEPLRPVFLRDQRCPRPIVARVSGEVRRGEKILLSDVHFDLRREAHVVVTGPNGSGKSSLLEQLVADETLVPERVLWLPQELTLDDVDADVQTLRTLDDETKGRVLQLAAALGALPQRLLASARLSCGEARKLRLALGLGRSVWLVVLDEPTNHLDLVAIEKLETALAEFPSAMVVVTHDERFAAAVAHEHYTLAHGRLVARPLGSQMGENWRKHEP